MNFRGMSRPHEITSPHNANDIVGMVVPFAASINTNIRTLTLSRNSCVLQGSRQGVAVYFKMNLSFSSNSSYGEHRLDNASTRTIQVQKGMVGKRSYLRKLLRLFQSGGIHLRTGWSRRWGRRIFPIESMMITGFPSSSMLTGMLWCHSGPYYMTDNLFFQWIVLPECWSIYGQSTPKRRLLRGRIDVPDKAYMFVRGNWP